MEELDCGSYFCGITQDGISNLKKIKKIRCGANDKIRNLNHLGETLKIVDCSGEQNYGQIYCGSIKQDGISLLTNVRYFNCSDNPYIHSVNHMANSLEVLECRGGKCGLNRDGISRLKKIKTIDCLGNTNFR